MQTLLDVIRSILGAVAAKNNTLAFGDGFTL
ncbi:hypothetical protein SCFA_280005 [anaerobic digester metagenome]|uniref:Uncharacterized protein n=1 Tax=anaerobic digester metagenome TaxID=1263854 RepID=A0A485LYS5_9ZZZZ